MKQNFSNFDFKKVFNIFNGSIFDVRFNKAGNISLDAKIDELKNINNNGIFSPYGTHSPMWDKVSYVFYNYNGKILIRAVKWFGNYSNSIYPLNMNTKSRNVHQSMKYNGEVYNWTGYFVKYSYFDNIDDAIVYFIEYLNLYHNIIDF